MDATRRFAELVRAREVALDEATLLIAAHGRPDLDVDAERDRLDDLARGVPAATLDGLRQYLFEELGFRGNVEEYGDPRNSYLDAVIDRRVGIPITLSVLTMEVGRRVGVHLDGVGMPGHFLVRSRDDPGLYMDPFGGGRFLGAPECREIFQRLHGPGVEFRPEYLATTPARDIVWRMLNNLRRHFAACGSLRDLRWVLELQLEFPDTTAAEQHRMAALLGSVGCLDRAADALDRVATALDGDEAERAHRQARRLRARLN